MTDPVPTPAKRPVGFYIAAALFGLAAGVAIGFALAPKAEVEVLTQEIPRDVFHYVDKPCKGCEEAAALAKLQPTATEEVSSEVP